MNVHRIVAQPYAGTLGDDHRKSLVASMARFINAHTSTVSHPPTLLFVEDAIGLVDDVTESVDALSVECESMEEALTLVVKHRNDSPDKLLFFIDTYFTTNIIPTLEPSSQQVFILSDTDTLVPTVSHTVLVNKERRKSEHDLKDIASLIRQVVREELNRDSAPISDHHETPVGQEKSSTVFERVKQLGVLQEHEVDPWDIQSFSSNLDSANEVITHAEEHVRTLKRLRLTAPENRTEAWVDKMAEQYSGLRNSLNMLNLSAVSLQWLLGIPVDEDMEMLTTFLIDSEGDADLTAPEFTPIDITDKEKIRTHFGL